jgi:hypothetical protein
MNDLFEIPKYKFQIPNKFQAPMTESIVFEISDFEHWSLSGIWYLGFGASAKNL